MKRTKLLVGISIFWLALALLMDGLNSLVLPMQLLRLNGQRATATTLGLLTFAGILTALVIQPMAGEWSDRLRGTWGRTGLIAASLLGIFAGLFALGLGQNLVGLFVAYLIIQAAASVARAAQAAFIPDMLPYDKTGHAAGVKTLMQTAGSALGFLVLGSFLAAAAVGPALMVVGAVLTVAFLLIVMLVGERPRTHGFRHSSPTWDDLYRFDFRTHRRFAWLVLSRSLFLLGVFAVTRFLLLFLVDRFALEPGRAAEQSGLLLGGFALVTALFAPLAASFAERIGNGVTMGAGVLLAGAGVAALAFGGSMGYVLVGVLLLAFGGGGFLAANWAQAAELIPAVQASKFNGLANTGVLTAAALAGLFGPLLDWGARFGGASSGDRGYMFLFGAALSVFLIGALAALPGLSVRPALGETVTEQS